MMSSSYSTMYIYGMHCAPVMVHSIAPFLHRNSEQAADILQGRCPTIVFPSNIATVYGSFSLLVRYMCTYITCSLQAGTAKLKSANFNFFFYG